MVAGNIAITFSASLSVLAFIVVPVVGQIVSTPVADEQGSSLRGSGSFQHDWMPLTSAQGQQVASPKVDKDFLLEVEAALDANLPKPQPSLIADITNGLRPMFASLDKNEYGKLGHTAVRYALHRFFVARHGWLMKGLDPAGDRFSSASPVEVLNGKASLHVRGIFEMRLASEGFGLAELAMFASLLETRISMEATQRLRTLFQKFDLPLDDKLEHKQAEKMMDYYMLAYILGKDIGETTTSQFSQLLRVMPEVYNHWAQTQKFIREVCEETLGKRDQYYFADIGDVLVKIGERFGKQQDVECQDMKQRLVKLEDDEKGCVPLSSFYKSAVTSGGKDWQFAENVDYLKTNGLIDQSDPQNMQVMIANYVYSQANCIASSDYYAVCCMDECETLLGQVERHVAGSHAAPSELMAFVASLPSSTVASNRTLPPSQVHRLYKIAEQHGGRVPIHGRLFMQWMHMVYPRECAFPHLSGTTKPVSSEDYQEAGKEATATAAEMEKFVNAPVQEGATSGQGQCGRWVDEEELFLGGPTTQRRNLAELETDYHTWLAASSVGLLCVFATATLVMIHVFKTMKHKLCSGWTRTTPQLMLV